MIVRPKKYTGPWKYPKRYNPNPTKIPGIPSWSVRRDHIMKTIDSCRFKFYTSYRHDSNFFWMNGMLVRQKDFEKLQKMGWINRLNEGVGGRATRNYYVRVIPKVEVIPEKIIEPYKNRKLAIEEFNKINERA